jgi:tripartite-type tricarboxylate transporter receptor subunit TctC
MKIVAVLIAAGCMAQCLLTGSARADDYPSRPIRVIVPFPAGSGSDQSARDAANYITRQTGQAVVVDNRPGANGFIAARQAAQAAPDGYTVFVTTMTTQSVNPHLYRRLPYDPRGDFIPVAMLSRSAMVLIVRNQPDQPASLAELTARIKAPNSKVNFGSGNMSSLLAAENYNRLITGTALHVHYKGNPQALTDILGGSIDFMFADMATGMPLVAQGRLRALAVTGSVRVSTLPDVQTMRELGAPIDLGVWTGAYLPAKTPPAIVARLNELLVASVQSKESQDRFRRTGGDAVPMSPAAFEKFNEEELELWGQAVRRAGIQPE